MTSCRLTTSTGAVVDEPTTVQLRELVAEVDRSGTSGFLIAERRGRSGDTYLQASRQSGSQWVVELRDGGPERHYRASAADAALVFAALASWIGDSTRWRTLGWQRVTRRPVAGADTRRSSATRLVTA